MRALFFGSPDFAVPCLEALHTIADVRAVISQPDRPAGRGKKLRPPAVKVCALDLGLEVLQPTKVRTADFAAQLRAFDVDVAVVVAYGRILPTAVLTAPRLGCVNVHASLLPRWRGAAPIQWAIVEGDRQSGVTLMQMDEGMDTGPILVMEETAIGPEETGGELFARLSAMGAQMIGDHLPRYVRGEIEPRPQPEAGATHARMLKKADGRIDWDEPAQRVHDRVRGMSPWPGAYTYLPETTIKVHRTRVLEAEGRHGEPGTVLDAEDGLRVAAAQGVVAIDELQEPGRKRLSAAQYVAGRGTPPRLLSEEQGEKP